MENTMKKTKQKKKPTARIDAENRRYTAYNLFP